MHRTRGDAQGADDPMVHRILEAIPALLGLARSLTTSTHDAEDLIQTAVLSVLTRRPDAHNMQAYLRRTMINSHIDVLRRLSVPTDALIEPSSRLDEIAASEPIETRLDLAVALRALPPIIRTVLVLRFLEDLSAAQVARLMDRPPGTIRRLTHEGLRLLRNQPWPIER